MKRIILSLGFFLGGMFLLSGCASSSGPTTRVGIVNGKYAAQTVIPNNNKGKIENITMGQSYYCIARHKDGKQTISFDLKSNQS